MSDPGAKLEFPVLEAAERLKEPLSKACLKLEIAGAIRRRRRDASSVDFIAIPKMEQDCNVLWETLDFSIDQPWNAGFIKRGDVLRSFVYRFPDGAGETQVNVYTATAETWGIRLLNHTGPSAFWIHYHTKLQAQGFFSNNGIVIDMRTGQHVPTRTEHEAFQLARIQYREPWARDGGVAARGGW